MQILIKGKAGSGKTRIARVLMSVFQAMGKTVLIVEEGDFQTDKWVSGLKPEEYDVIVTTTTKVTP